ncbi:MAG TPA: GH92 family glycosyl hydrolase [Dinghuibacter sp.]|uniref:GH92 family glycosyl hydrolase n=1 Tax=Dinghuibacter sp. TaxID=2024697 RepID=UPI002B8E93D4|nr:GH92 family glycosyl hydrolase [Dinghuibacter sp.]HTJ11021.1 GH92 family glycosyl hydrolase [Dinghuibacter sp.]
MTPRWLILCLLPLAARAQVDPFIGTTVSAVDTRWGNDGGTYPGAVAPNGYAQLTPETRPDGGYDYRDSLIYRFSCMGHHSGFPGGSAGRFFVMPLAAAAKAATTAPVAAPAGAQPAGSHARPFSHGEEHATPGYYRVRLTDDNTLVEAVATPRAGVFRFTFAPGVTPRILVEDTARAAFRFSVQPLTHTGNIYTFPPVKTLLLTIGVSATDGEGARRNMDAECNAPFDTLVKRARKQWAQKLNAVTIDDNDKAKTIFYTALYHSLLLPWIISDVDGRYRGADNKIHQAKGHPEYGGFSPWDTYRTLNPLRAWLYPSLESAIARSMMDVYRQTGRLPAGPMTGNHAIITLVDDYRKGIAGIDSAELSAAVQIPTKERDVAVFGQKGYIPSNYPESVTRTLDYAYDKEIINQFNRVDNVRTQFQLFDPQTLLLLPRYGDTLNRHPGNGGYKEGDTWGYSYFMPQAPDELIDLMGGDSLFAGRLDSVLTDGRVLFDNETILHLPYFFDYAGRSDLTQRHVREILEQRYRDIPGGLPGNDDLGAMSSWYVWSALGLYPFCPGRPSYAIGAPLFKEVHAKNWRIRSNASRKNRYIQAIRINGKPYRQATISHAELKKGGTIDFLMGPAPGPALYHANPKPPRFTITGVSLEAPLIAGSPARIGFVIHKTGPGMGTFHVRLWADGKILATHNATMYQSDTLRFDTLSFRLYRPGPVTLRLDSSATAIHADVRVPDGPQPSAEVTGLDALPLTPIGTKASVKLTVRNPGWEARALYIPVLKDGQQTTTDTVTLKPGEEAPQNLNITLEKPGIHQIKIGGQKTTIKAYATPEEATILDIEGRYDGKPLDLPTTHLGESLTMMCWVYPTERRSEDIFTLGDYNVLQASGGSLTFFAGGWGRGDCTVDLPGDWIGRWHHIAGVCSPDGLRLYIDGELKKYTPLGKTSLDYPDGIWMIGRNFEFPGERQFQGQVASPAIFLTALDGGAIRARASKTP